MPTDHETLMMISVKTQELGLLIAEFFEGFTQEIVGKLPHVAPALLQILNGCHGLLDANQVPGYEGEMNALAPWQRREAAREAARAGRFSIDCFGNPVGVLYGSAPSEPRGDDGTDAKNGDGEDPDGTS